MEKTYKCYTCLDMQMVYKPDLKPGDPDFGKAFFCPECRSSAAPSDITKKPRPINRPMYDE